MRRIGTPQDRSVRGRAWGSSASAAAKQMGNMGAHALTASEIVKLRPHVPEWNVVPRRGVPRLQRTFACRTFSEAMWFTLKIGELAEREGQRPTILTNWDQVTVVLHTPNTAGLHRNDFIMASKADQIYEDRPESHRPSRSDA